MCYNTAMEIVKLDMRPDLNDVMHEISIRIKNERNIYVRKHTHSFWEFMFIESGSIMQSINGVEKSAEKHELYIIRPESVHQLKADPSRPVMLFNFEVDCTFLSNLLASMGFPSLDSVFDGDHFSFTCSNEETLSFIKLLNKSQDEKSTESLKWNLLKVIIAKFVTKAITDLNTTPKYTTSNQIISQALAELDNTNNFRVSIGELFKSLNYSHEHISRLFKKEGIDPPVRIFLRNKLSYSCTLLASSKMKIIDIIDICGLNSTSYYNKVFKKEYGITPMEYRKKFNAFN